MTKQEFAELSETDQLWHIDSMIDALLTKLHEHATNFDKHNDLNYMLAFKKVLGTQNELRTMIVKAVYED